MAKRAFLIIDVQRDFCPGGALGVEGGDEVVPLINTLAPRFPLVFASKDWHPGKTVHFENWPPHCVRASSGAQFHPDLNLEQIDQILLKGTGNSDDGYSAFEATNTDLEATLRKEGVDTVILAGLTTEYCVKSTALDATRLGFRTLVVADAIRPVNLKPGDADSAWADMLSAGVEKVFAKDLE